LPARSSCKSADRSNDPALNLPPLDPPAPRSSYPAPFQNDDQLWRAIDKNVEALVDDRSATGKPVN